MKILREVYIEYKTRGRETEVDIDEAWSIFQKVSAKNFMETAARRFRKYDSSICVITQGIDDMYQTTTTKAVWSNSAHKIYLQMDSNIIETAILEKKLSMQEFSKEWFKTLATIPGRFSEMYLDTGSTHGVTRLVVDRFSYGLFTTKQEEKQKISALANEHGVTVGEILQILTGRTPICEILAANGVSVLLLNLALAHQAQRANGIRIGKILIDMGIPVDKISQALKIQEEQLSWDKVFHKNY